jgi:hypothetical protein
MYLRYGKLPKVNTDSEGQSTQLIVLYIRFPDYFLSLKMKFYRNIMTTMVTKIVEFNTECGLI